MLLEFFFWLNVWWLAAYIQDAAPGRKPIVRKKNQRHIALKAEEDVLYAITHPGTVIYEWTTGSSRMRVLKQDLRRIRHFPGRQSISLPEVAQMLCGQYIDPSEREKARAFLTNETMSRCVAEHRRQSITLLLDSAHFRYDCIRMSVVPSPQVKTKAYLLLEMMDWKEKLYPILESHMQETVDYCYCINGKTDYFLRIIGNEGAYGMPPREGDHYTREMEAHVDRFVVEEERTQVKEQMRMESVLRALETEAEYSFVANTIGEHGEIRKKRLIVKPFHQSKDCVILQSVDITELSSKNRMLEDARLESITDPLTQLYNRLGGERLVQKAMAETRAEKNQVMILMDLDNFKKVNDSFGHPMGDWVLREAAQRLRKCFRAEDIIYRLGGDEYVVFLKSIPHKDDIHPVLNRLVKEMQIACEKNGETLLVTASVGATISQGQPYEELYKQADIALYHAKKKKRGYSLFEKTDETDQDSN